MAMVNLGKGDDALDLRTVPIDPTKMTLDGGDGIDTLRITGGNTNGITGLGAAAGFEKLDIADGAGTYVLNDKYTSLSIIDAKQTITITIQGGIQLKTITGDDSDSLIKLEAIGGAAGDRAGNDYIDGSNGDDEINGGDGADTINPNEGNNIIIGSLGIDLVNLFPGSNSDTLIFTALDQSAFGAADIVSNFTAGDKIDVSDIAALMGGSFGGNVVGFGSVSAQMALSNTAVKAIFDTNNDTLYIDANKSGSINTGDMAVQLSGLVTFIAADLLF